MLIFDLILHLEPTQANKCPSAVSTHFRCPSESLRRRHFRHFNLRYLNRIFHSFLPILLILLSCNALFLSIKFLQPQGYLVLDRKFFEPTLGVNTKKFLGMSKNFQDRSKKNFKNFTRYEIGSTTQE